MQKITPFLWFEKNMKEITDFYISVFPGAHVQSNGTLSDTPSGDAEMATLTLYGQEFSLMTAGPYLPFNPTISFTVTCDSSDEVDTLWNKLLDEGKILMELASYPFAERYGWVQDKYGVTWQIMFSTTQKSDQKIIPTLMFAGDVCGKGEEAVTFYTSVFHNAHTDYVMQYDGSEPVDDVRAKIKHAGFTIENFRLALMDSGKVSPLSFQQAISFIVHCDNQEEVDYYWGKLTDGGTEVQCGWLNDRFGLPWQVVPTAMERMMSEGTKEQIVRVTEAFMKMKKFDIKTLEEAYRG